MLGGCQGSENTERVKLLILEGFEFKLTFIASMY